jgi:hypothetical protein
MAADSIESQITKIDDFRLIIKTGDLEKESAAALAECHIGSLLGSFRSRIWSVKTAWCVDEEAARAGGFLRLR